MEKDEWPLLTAIIKSYTSLEQSKKLAEILPPDSCDMWWREVSYGFYHIEAEIPNGWYNEPPKGIPCWSLAALLELMPKQFGRYTKSLYWFDNAWHCEYIDEDSEAMNDGTSTDNPIDACVEMITKLHEQKLL